MTARVPGRRPTWIARQLANEASSCIRARANGPRSNSMRGSWITATPMATIAPANSDITMVSIVISEPAPMTTASIPNEPAANIESFDHEPPELASRDENSPERLLDRPGDRGDGEEHGGGSVDPVDLERDRERDERDESDGDPLGLEQRAPDTGIEPVQHGERITDPARLDRVDGDQHAQQQAEHPETGRSQFTQRDERQQQTRRRNDELRQHRSDRPAVHRQ